MKKPADLPAKRTKRRAPGKACRLRKNPFLCWSVEFGNVETEFGI